MEREEFKNCVEEYYKGLMLRIDKGTSSLSNIENSKDKNKKESAYNLFNEITKEASMIEILMNYYHVK